MTIDFDKYTDFVDAVTSDSSKDFVYLADRLVELDRKGANCLLYTSPSPRDGLLSRMPSSA